jgi:hypothetical protein
MNEVTQVSNEREVQVTRAPANPEDFNGPLLPPDSIRSLQTLWDQTQTAFVDDPRAAVQQADDLVKSAIQKLSESFTTAKDSLEQQWDLGDQVDTENLRQILRKYRAFFQRILAV